MTNSATQSNNDTTGELESESEVQTKALMHRFAKAFMRKDMGEIKACLSEQFEWRLPTGDRVAGREAALDAMQTRFSMPNAPVFSKSRFRYFGDTAVQTYRVRVINSDGTECEVDGCDVYNIQNGSIVTKDAYWKQIG